MVNKLVQNLLQKEVSRKEFLSLAAFAAGSILGLGSIIKLLTGSKSKPTTTNKDGYANGGYGD